MCSTNVASGSLGDASGLCLEPKINKMMNTRLKRVSFDKVYEAMKELLKQEYSVEELDKSMCIFIIGITKLKSIDSLNISSDIKSGVSIFSSCWDKYSKEKFIKFIENQYCLKLSTMFGDENMKRQLEIYNKKENKV